MEMIGMILVALIPSTALIVLVYLFLKKQNEKEVNALSIQLKKERQTFFLEPRADAYQRIVLLMERITPHNLVMRIYSPELTVQQFQSKLLDAIRQEFDHNVAQQIFISSNMWDHVKKSKEETVKIVNIAAKSLGEDAKAMDLSAKIFEIISEVGELPTEITIKGLKEEFQRLF